MPLNGMNSIMKEVRGGIGTMSLRRSFSLPRFNYQLRRARSSNAVLDDSQLALIEELAKQSCWATMPPELLRDVIQRVESSDPAWPSRRDVVVCASVCRSWREITKQIVQTPEQSGKLTFPISLKQPGPRNYTVQCFIRRNRSSSTYQLWLCLGQPTAMDEGKFLLTAREVRRATCTDYVISLDLEHKSRKSSTYVGKLQSNFLGTKFKIFDAQPQLPEVILQDSEYSAGSKRMSMLSSSFKASSGNYNVAHIGYERNVFRSRGPRRIHCTLQTISEAAMEPKGTAPTPTEFSNCRLDDSMPFSGLIPSPKSKSAVADCSTADFDTENSAVLSKDGPLVLKSKAPRWHNQLQCWCLNFRGRVTIASVKNFQLVVGKKTAPPTPPHTNHDKILLQFGKIGKDVFTMEYCYPLSAFQAFAICLSSFHHKLACE